jgi:hypothetical protein
MYSIPIYARVKMLIGIDTLHHMARGFEVQLGDVRLERLAQQQAFAFLRRLVNYDPSRASAAALTYNTQSTTSSRTRRSSAIRII